MNCINEILRVSNQLDIKVTLVEEDKSKLVINKVMQVFTPQKITGHLAISNDEVITFPVEDYEFIYSNSLPKSKGYIFFDQQSETEGQVVMIEDVRFLCRILEESFGMEYFLVDEDFTYLIALNWYVIEGAGKAVNLLSNI